MTPAGVDASTTSSGDASTTPPVDGSTTVPTDSGADAALRPPGADRKSAKIGPGGGALTSAHGKMTLTVPAVAGKSNVPVKATGNLTGSTLTLSEIEVGDANGASLPNGSIKYSFSATKA